MKPLSQRHCPFGVSGGDDFFDLLDYGFFGHVIKCVSDLIFCRAWVSFIFIQNLGPAPRLCLLTKRSNTLIVIYLQSKNRLAYGRLVKRHKRGARHGILR